MRSLLSRGLWLVVFLVPALVGLLHGGPSPAPVDPIPELVKQLGSDVFARREDASKKLIALGEKAIPALRKAEATSSDVEVRRRVKEIVIAILPTGRKSKSINLELVLIEGGEFVMGSPIGERNRRIDEDRHGVWIKDSFYLGRYEVTQEEYQRVMDINPSWFSINGAGKDKVGGINTGVYPVENVTWYDAIEFCNRLSKRDELPAYYQVADVIRQGDFIRRAKVTIVGGSGYRLPTEAEWEFACRAYTDTPYHFQKNPTGREGNFKSSIVPGGYGGGPLWQALNRTTNVGNYQPNGRSLYDMHGNVGEWCWDFYDKDYYTISPRQNPHGPKTGTHRVCRGGSWLVTEASCRSASRFMELPGEGNYQVGFRVARNP